MYPVSVKRSQFPTSVPETVASRRRGHFSEVLRLILDIIDFDPRGLGDEREQLGLLFNLLLLLIHLLLLPPHQAQHLILPALKYSD